MQARIIELEEILNQCKHNAHRYGCICCGVNYEEQPIVLSSKGILYEFSGNSFVPMSRNGQEVQFPIAEEIHNTLDTLNPGTGFGTSVSLGPRMVPRGVTV